MREIFGYILVVYGILCIYIGLVKPPFIWKMKKFEIMQKMFGGAGRLQLFVLVWGAVALAVGFILL